MRKEEDELNVISVRKIYELLNLIHKKPELWLTSKSIISLQNFLNGFMILGLGNDIYHNGEPDFNEYKYWILSKGKACTGVGNVFSEVLLAECKGDEVKAFEKFFEYLEMFKKNFISQSPSIPPV